MSDFDAILMRNVDDRWYTLLGIAGDEYSNDYFRRYAIPSETREKAHANALALAEQRGIALSRIFDDSVAGAASHFGSKRP